MPVEEEGILVALLTKLVPNTTDPPPKREEGSRCGMKDYKRERALLLEFQDELIHSRERLEGWKARVEDTPV
jgi:hypothetical protein